jgi:PAS domain-containing protein
MPKRYPRFQRSIMTRLLSSFVVGSLAIGAGVAALKLTHGAVGGDAAWFGLFASLVTVLGVMLVTRSITARLNGVLELLKGRAPAESFYELARRSPREFSLLSQSIGGTLMRLDNTTTQLARCERELAHLQRHAPAALIRLDASGNMVEANACAVDLFELHSAQDPIGRNLFDFVPREDRQALKAAILDLDLDPRTTCRMRLKVPGGSKHTTVECFADRDADGTVQHVWLSIIDDSVLVAAQHKLDAKAQLLTQLLTHISDAVLSVDATGCIVAANQRLGTLLRCDPDKLVGKRYTADQLWRPLGAPDHHDLIRRLNAIESDTTHCGEHLTDGMCGTILFQGIPVSADADGPGGRLWVIRDVTDCDASTARRWGNQLAVAG